MFNNGRGAQSIANSTLGAPPAKTLVQDCVKNVQSLREQVLAAVSPNQPLAVQVSAQAAAARLEVITQFLQSVKSESLSAATVEQIQSVQSQVTQLAKDLEQLQLEKNSEAKPEGSSENTEKVAVEISAESTLEPEGPVELSMLLSLTPEMAHALEKQLEEHPSVNVSRLPNLAEGDQDSEYVALRLEFSDEDYSAVVSAAELSALENNPFAALDAELQGVLNELREKQLAMRLEKEAEIQQSIEDQYAPKPEGGV